jgi:hypothetical protein
MRRMKPEKAPFQPTVRNVFIHNWYNTVCNNLRLNFVIHQA